MIKQEIQNFVTSFNKQFAGSEIVRASAHLDLTASVVHGGTG